MATSVLPSTAPPSPPISRLAVVSVVSGVLGWSLLPGLGSILAIVAGHAARARIDASRDRLGGRRLAFAGMVLGYSFVIAMATLAAAVVLGVLLYVGSATHAESEVDVVHRALEVMPEGASLESRVIAMIAGQLGYDEDDVTPESDLDELGLDDEDCLELVQQLRDAFSVEIGDDEIDRSTTVADLVALIEQRQKEASNALEPAPGPTPPPERP
ncbi:MAG: DUF4190 domain-containing protein [Isosphaeraceae bacterium]